MTLSRQRSGSEHGPLDLDMGSAPAEFVMVMGLLLVLTFGVLQLGAAMLVRNTVLDSAAEGARWAALAGNGPADGVARTREELTVALGPAYAHDVRSIRTTWRGQPVAEVTVVTPLPVIGLLGLPSVIRVSGHAVLEPGP